MSTTTKKVCAMCGSMEDAAGVATSFKACGRCLKTFYCCKEHQTENWKEHKKSCGKQPVEAVDESLDETVLLRLANGTLDMLQDCKLHSEIIAKSSDSSIFSCSSLHSLSVSREDKARILAMTELSMRAEYEKNWGWDGEARSKELFHPSTRFLLIRRRMTTESGGGEESTRDVTTTTASESSESSESSPSSPASSSSAAAAAAAAPSPSTEATIEAFAAYRFEWDDDDEPEHPVLYLYELQVDAACQGQGLGRHLMSMLVAIANKWSMWKVLLTVFKTNTKAVAFYKSIGFGIDVNSPSRCGFKKEMHELMSNKPNLR